MIAFRLAINAWDCFIYSGYLFVLTIDNELQVFDWSGLVESQATSLTYLALNVGLARSDFVYTNTWRIAFDEETFFERFAESVRLLPFEYAIDGGTLDRFRVYRVADVNPDLADCFTIFNNVLYFGTESGLYGRPLRISTQRAPRIDEPEKLWDGNPVDMAGGGLSALAIAAASEGAFQHRIENENRWFDDAGETASISPLHTTAIDWSSPYSIFRTSPISGGELIARMPTKAGGESEHEETIASLLLQDIAQYDYSWGAYGKIFAVRDSVLEIFNYSQADAQKLYKQYGAEAITAESVLKRERHVPLQLWKGRVLDAGVSAFGTVIECENALVIMNSQGQFYTSPEPFARWRVYNSSKRYLNHLHIINDSDLLILGLTDDLFIRNDKERVTAIRRIVRR